jgi:hypothetical protein
MLTNLKEIIIVDVRTAFIGVSMYLALDFTLFYKSIIHKSNLFITRAQS